MRFYDVVGCGRCDLMLRIRKETTEHHTVISVRSMDNIGNSYNDAISKLGLVMRRTAAMYGRVF